MKEQFLNLSGLTDLVTYMKLCIAQHKVIIPRASFSLFPETGDENNIYIDTSTNAIYRWNDTDKKFVLLAKPPRTIAISEGTNNGEITLKVDNIASNAKVHGLTSTAFTESNKFATAAQGAKADSAVQTITLSSGTKNGTIKIKVNNITTDNIEVAGLGSAAFSDIGIFAAKSHTHSKSDVGLGNVDNTADIDKSVKYATSAGAVSWKNITDKPTLFPPQQHNHDSLYYRKNEVDSLLSGKSDTGHTHVQFIQEVKFSNGTYSDPLNGTAVAIKASGGIASDLIYEGGKTLADKYQAKGSYAASSHKQAYTSDECTSYESDSNTMGVTPAAVKKAFGIFGPKAHTHKKTDITDFPTSLPASDVYGWAKASSKPSYSWSEITSKPSTFTPASHTHAYIPLSGGTITGSIIRSSGGSWISARNNVAVRGTATGKDSWNPVVGQATPNGYWTIGNLASNDNLAFSYTSNTNYNAGNNSATTVYLPVQEGTIITSATIGSQSVKYATSAGSAGSVAWGNVSGKPSSYTPSSHTHDDRYYTETEINTKLGAKLGAVSANGYYGMARPDGNTSDWIRTTTAGIIPYQSGGAGAGHCGLGTSSWYFSNAYIDTVNCVNTNASGYLQANGLINTYSEYQSQKGKRDWRFGSATGNGDQNWFGFYDYTSGFHGGWYGPDHIFRAYGELQSTSANSFRSVYGNYGFIIRNDGANIYFMMTKSGDPYGIWNDNYTIFTPNGEWQVKKSPYDNGMSTARGYVVVSDSNDNRVYSISNYNANYLKVRCGLNTYHCTYSNSDIRLKKNINNTSITNALSVINSIKVRQFDWKETNIHQSIGFVADELEKLDPNFSQGGGVTKDGGIDVKSVNSFYLQGYIVKALQELSSQVSDLKQENKRLKQKLNMCN